MMKLTVVVTTVVTMVDGIAVWYGSVEESCSSTVWQRGVLLKVTVTAVAALFPRLRG